MHDGMSLPAGSRILISGATSDFAQALLPTLVAQPVVLGLHGFRSLHRLDRWQDGAAKVATFGADLSCAAAAHQLVADFLAWAGGIDVLIQLSGNMVGTEHWLELPPEKWQEDLDVNLTAPFFLAQAALAKMSDGGRVVFTSTASTVKGGGATSLAYGVAKSGVETLTKGLARFCASRNILVNCVCPGFIDTRFQTEKAGKTPEQLKARAEFVPLKRAGTAADVANAILFLISEQNQFINGQCLRIDGADFL